MQDADGKRAIRVHYPFPAMFDAKMTCPRHCFSQRDLFPFALLVHQIGATEKASAISATDTKPLSYCAPRTELARAPSFHRSVSHCCRHGLLTLLTDIQSVPGYLAVFVQRPRAGGRERGSRTDCIGGRRPPLDRSGKPKVPPCSSTSR